MFLFEFADPTSTSYVVIVNQLKSDIDNGHIDPNNFSTDQLLAYLQDNANVALDVTDLYDMIKKPPLNTVISNIQGDKVVFKGHDETPPPDQTQSQEVVGQMAQNAMPTQ